MLFLLVAISIDHESCSLGHMQDRQYSRSACMHVSCTQIGQQQSLLISGIMQSVMISHHAFCKCIDMFKNDRQPLYVTESPCNAILTGVHLKDGQSIHVSCT